MRKINKIIIHCSATKPSMDIGVTEIRDWHVNGNSWGDVGYHHVIRRDGTLENGRAAEVAGAHCKNHNHDSIGICLVGGVREDDVKIAENNFTQAQFDQLEILVKWLMKEYKDIEIFAHSHFAEKDCPCFDVNEWCERCGLD